MYTMIPPTYCHEYIPKISSKYSERKKDIVLRISRNKIATCIARIIIIIMIIDVILLLIFFNY